MRLTLAPLGRFDLGAAAAALIAFLAFRMEALTAGGALAAFMVGSITFGALDVGGAAVLLAFFFSSLALSRIGRARKRALERDLGKTGPRDAMQVLANGGVAAICALLALGGDERYAIAFCGAFAAATADTWGTELGTIFGGRPRSIVTWRPINAGLSGGVTAIGTAAEIAGAFSIAAIARAFGFHCFGQSRPAGSAARSSIRCSAPRSKNCAGARSAAAPASATRTAAARTRRRCVLSASSTTTASISSRRSPARESPTF